MYREVHSLTEFQTYILGQTWRLTANLNMQLQYQI